MVVQKEIFNPLSSTKLQIEKDKDRLLIPISRRRGEEAQKKKKRGGQVEEEEKR